MATLTSRTLAQASAITPTTLIHIVTTADTSQSLAGSSYKAELQQLAGLFSGLSFTGGTVSGSTVFTNGVTGSSISATTYQNLPVSGLTAGTNIGLVNNNGNYTVSVTGITGGSTFSGGTVTGATSFTNGLTANTISATTYQNLPVSGLTEGSNISISGTNGNFTISVTGITGGSTFTGGTVTGATSFTNGLSANTISATTIGDSGDCVDDIYVSNIHSCSPLNINPLDEGNVYFGSTSGVTVDVTNSRLGIGTNNPQYPIEVISNNSQLFYNPTSAGGLLVVSGQTNVPRIGIIIPSYLTNPSAAVTLGLRAWDDMIFTNYGNVGDTFLRAADESNGLNLINSPGVGTQDYIRFYAGNQATATPDIHIQGSGVTRGYVGIGTDVPSEKLDVSGKTKTTNFQMTSGANNGYVLTSDASGNASWQIPTGGGGTFTGGTVSGATNFTGGLTATTISATTYNNLPVSGLTAGTNIGLTNNNGNFTISVTGITGGSTFTGGTVSGATNFTNGLSANTISATTYQNLPVSGLTAGTNIGLVNNNGNYTVSVTGITLPINDPYNNIGSTGTSFNWNVSGLSTNYQVTLTANTTLSLTNVRNGEYGTLIVTQDGVGGRTLSLGNVNGGSGTHRVANGGSGTIILTSNASATDILTFTYNGSVMYWTVGNDYT